MAAQVFNLSNPQTAYKDIESPLKFQTRCVTCFPDSTGYLVGGKPFSTPEAEHGRHVASIAWHMCLRLHPKLPKESS